MYGHSYHPPKSSLCTNRRLYHITCIRVVTTTFQPHSPILNLTDLSHTPKHVFNCQHVFFADNTRLPESASTTHLAPLLHMFSSPTTHIHLPTLITAAQQASRSLPPSSTVTTDNRDERGD